MQQERFQSFHLLLSPLILFAFPAKTVATPPFIFQIPFPRSFHQNPVFSARVKILARHPSLPNLFACKLPRAITNLSSSLLQLVLLLSILKFLRRKCFTWAKSSVAAPLIVFPSFENNFDRSIRVFAPLFFRVEE